MFVYIISILKPMEGNIAVLKENNYYLYISLKFENVFKNY